jgi:hypothetical protein
VELANELQPEETKGMEDGKMVREGPGMTLVLTTNSQADVAILHSLLDESGIEFLLENELGHQAYTFTGPVRLFVRGEDIEEARELLRDFDPKLFAFSSRSAEAGEEGSAAHGTEEN